jgi:hypothetical protein
LQQAAQGGQRDFLFVLALDLRAQLCQRQVIVFFDQFLHEEAGLVVQEGRLAAGVRQRVGRAGLSFAADKITDGRRRDAEQVSDLLLRVIVVFIGRDDFAAQVVGVEVIPKLVLR